MSRILPAVFRRTHTIRQLLQQTPSDSVIQINGWVRSLRLQKRVGFAMISDGTCAQNLQIVFPNPQLARRLTNGASVQVSGKLVTSPGTGQSTEFVATGLDILGECPADAYPIQKQALNVDFLRDHAHLRLRTEALSAVLRLRNSVKRTLQDFFDRHSFCYVHTPIVTSNDAEGAGETFRLAPVAAGEAAASQEFFGKHAYLTVSSQLHLEAAANAIARVWTLSPCFRAERSQTSRHLAEFWMLEAEWAFIQSVGELCEATEGLLKEVIHAALSSPDAAFLWQTGDSDRQTRLKEAASDSSWARMTYSEAIEALQAQYTACPGAFEFPPEWGKGLQSEHERWLAEQYIGKPVFVTDYPVTLKPFYMRKNNDGKTVACFDLLVPHVGELIGGSLREERESKLTEALRNHNLDEESYGWYIDLRKYGGAPHGGFGLGFERLISWISGIENVRESIAFPRWAGRMLL